MSVFGHADNFTNTDEVAAVKAEAKRLKDLGVSIIIAAGHAGYEVDVLIAAEVPEVDVVVGGHSHTFLWTGPNPPSIEHISGEYPTYITQKGSGRVVPVVQVYCYTKYLGEMNLNFDDKVSQIKNHN
jgi:2',3'-cyclic-nucleotide 2'-phosphodiesterase (5'-nucleotidase family)